MWIEPMELLYWAPLQNVHYIYPSDILVGIRYISHHIQRLFTLSIKSYIILGTYKSPN